MLSLNSLTGTIADVSRIVAIHKAKWAIVNCHSNYTHVVCVQHSASSITVESCNYIPPFLYASIWGGGWDRDIYAMWTCDLFLWLLDG